MSTDSADVLTSLTTLRDYIRWAAGRFTAAGLFFGHGNPTALDEAAALILHTLHQPYDLVDYYVETHVTRAERQQLLEVIELRISSRKPVAYITHEARFANLSFYVDERVLVPRSSIAELIQERFSPWIDATQVMRVLDLCTGSACIAIACAYAFPEAIVDAVELSADALEVAAINVAKHELEGEVQLWASDLFNALPPAQYDIIVSNPPYVAVREWQQLPAEFHAEPEMGFTGGESGLDIVLRILVQARDFLSPQGILVVEVGSSAETLQSTFPTVPFYWLHFEQGCEGVFLLTAEQLTQFQLIFKEAVA
ncbi:MAG: 50S ribosomal protein L3 N(5)-glutamine methyltransferase [Methylococcaceae bacterium]|nr:50S ribosomal protein L3 N(5)-glutamine methyltransferase [Methylococcaceae bacterium]